MGLFDALGDKFEETVGDLDFAGLINGVMDQQRQNATPLVLVGPPPAAVALQPTTLSGAVQPANLMIALPIIALVGVGAYLIFKKR